MVRITLSLTENQVDRIKKTAKDRQLSVSDVMRRILDGELPFSVHYDGESKDDRHEDHKPKPVAVAG